jgi:squalene synthase HpnC
VADPVTDEPARQRSVPAWSVAPARPPSAGPSAVLTARATDAGVPHAASAGAGRPEAGAGKSVADDAERRVAAKAAHENFPVALRLLPRRYRQHLMAIYVYARTADDIGDQALPTQRLRLLAELEADVRRLYASIGEPGAAHGACSAELPAVRKLARTVTECKIPIDPFVDLIRANQQDQVITRYQTFDDLVGYCRLSANPVGRMVLHVFGCFSTRRAELSDLICTGLQLTEHWQDVAEDLRSGRIYLPLDDLARYGCSEGDLAAARAGPAVRDLMSFEVGRARSLIDAGAPLVGTLRGAARAAVAGYVAGGRAALAAIEAVGYDVLATTPKPGTIKTSAELVTAFARGR